MISLVLCSSPLTVSAEIYTHTFEIVVNSVIMEGELCFNGEVTPMIKTQSDMEMPIKELKRISAFLEHLISLYKMMGRIERIEIIEIP